MTNNVFTTSPRSCDWPAEEGQIYNLLVGEGEGLELVRARLISKDDVWRWRALKPTKYIQEWNAAKKKHNTILD